MYSDKASVAGLNQETKTDDFLKNVDLEDLTVEKSDDLSENARELEQPFEVLDESGIVLVSEENTFKSTPEGCEDVDEVDDAIKGNLFSCCIVKGYVFQHQNN